MKTKKILYTIFCKTFAIFFLLSLYIKLVSSSKKLKSYNENNENVSIDDRYNHLYKIASRIMLSTSTKVRFRGEKNIPQKPVLYVVNHKSSLDPIAILKTFSKISESSNVLPPVFIAKKEIKSHKKISKAAELIDTIFIDRSNLRDALRVINKEKEILNLGKQSIVVFIEGTRIPGDEFGEFKSAALEPAYATFCPIVPIVIYGLDGVNSANKKKLIKYKEVTVEFLEPIKYKDFIGLNKETVSNKLKQVMQQKYNDLKQNPNWNEEDEK